MNTAVNEEHSNPENLNNPSSDALETLYNTLFHPITTFQSLAEETSLPNPLRFQALGAVILISALAPATQLANQGGDMGSLIWATPLNTILGVIIWGFTGLSTGLLAYAFTGKARIATFLTLSGLATLPWLLLGPISILKFGLGPVGTGITILGSLLIWLWSVLLFGLAIMSTYRMPLERLLIVLATPFITLLFLLGWTFGFLDNIKQLSLPF